MPVFYPVWITPVGLLDSVDENDTVNIALHAIRSSTFMGQNSDTVDIGNSSTHVANVFVNSSELTTADYSVVGHSLVFDIAIAATSVVQINTSETITYTLLHDNLPPGLSLTNTGTIAGKVGVLPSNGETLTYTFGVRIGDGISVRDRQFSINATPVSSTTNPPGWGTLPSVKIQHATPQNFRYVPLGSTTRAAPFLFQLNLFTPNGVPPTLVVGSFFGANEIDTPFNSIPKGITVDPHTGLVSGSVDPSMPLGNYFFEITMLDFLGNPITVGTGAHPVVFQIKVVPPFSVLEPLVAVIWNTAAGSLGTLIEGQVCPFAVSASATNGQPVQYALQANTPLPPGLTLDPNSGLIEGVLGHTNSNRTFTFVIRATVPGQQVFADRSFSISTTMRYTSAEYTNVDFKIRAIDSRPMAEFYANVIQHADYFRPTDPNFSDLASSNNLKVLVVAGLKGGDLTLMESTIRASSIFAPVRLLLGEHKVAKAVYNGQTTYEVLYREVIDPSSRAGGFTITNGVPSPTPIVYPESLQTQPITFTPTSINNIRDEFVSKVGFPTLDTSVANNFISENLPVWMTSYFPAVVIAYLAPGSGQTVLDRISVSTIPTQIERPTDNPNPLAAGHELLFNQYFIEFQMLSPATTFDTRTTTFDDTDMVLDVNAFSGGTFFRMNRSTFNTT